MDSGYGEKMLTRCLKGGGVRDDLPSQNLPLQSGDTLYLCTDGFYATYENEVAEGLSFVTSNDKTLMDDATCLTIKL